MKTRKKKRTGCTGNYITEKRGDEAIESQIRVKMRRLDMILQKEREEQQRRRSEKKARKKERKRTKVERCMKRARVREGGEGTEISVLIIHP